MFLYTVQVFIPKLAQGCRADDSQENRHDTGSISTSTYLLRLRPCSRRERLVKCSIPLDRHKRCVVKWRGSKESDFFTATLGVLDS